MKTVLITGAADGIGRALAFEFARQGCAIIGVDFDSERSAKTQAELNQHGFTAQFIQADFSQPDFLNDLLPKIQPVDILLNNAGISAVGAFESLDWNRQQRVLDINLRAPIQLTTAILKNNLLKPNGSLVFISSLSHYVGYPGAAIYAASKDGLATYARNLRIALKKKGTHVLVIFPGPTRTSHASRYSPNNARESKRMSPEILAAHIFNAVQSRRKKLFPGIMAWVMGMFGLWFPVLAERIMKHTLFDILNGRTLT
jgi:short-subunit dehydrogenase